MFKRTLFPWFVTALIVTIIGLGLKFWPLFRFLTFDQWVLIFILNLTIFFGYDRMVEDQERAKIRAEIQKGK